MHGVHFRVADPVISGNNQRNRVASRSTGQKEYMHWLNWLRRLPRVDARPAAPAGGAVLTAYAWARPRAGECGVDSGEARAQGAANLPGRGDISDGW